MNTSRSRVKASFNVLDFFAIWSNRIVKGNMSLATLSSIGELKKTAFHHFLGVFLDRCIIYTYQVM